MNPRLLQLGAEVLPGWRFEAYPKRWVVIGPYVDGSATCWYEPDEPAVDGLPRELANELEALILRCDIEDANVMACRDPAREIALFRMPGHGPGQRIAAALVALGRITLDEAREMVQ